MHAKKIGRASTCLSRKPKTDYYGNIVHADYNNNKTEYENKHNKIKNNLIRN